MNNQLLRACWRQEDAWGSSARQEVGTCRL